MNILTLHEYQEVPSSLESLTAAIAAAHTSLEPITPATDSADEEDVAQAWGTFANEVEELMDDLVERSSLLINTFGLETAIYDQLLTFNSTFLVNTPFPLHSVLICG